MTDKVSEARRLISIALIVLGTLWMGLSGLCTLGGLLVTCSLASHGGGWSALWLAILPGAVSIGVGWLVRWIGGRIRPRPGNPADEFE